MNDIVFAWKGEQGARQKTGVWRILHRSADSEMTLNLLNNTVAMTSWNLDMGVFVDTSCGAYLKKRFVLSAAGSHLVSEERGWRAESVWTEALLWGQGKVECLMWGHQSSVVAEHSIGHSQFAPPPLTEEFTILLNFHSNIKDLLDGILEAVEVVFNQSCEGRERTEAWLLQVTKGNTVEDPLWPIETNMILYLEDAPQLSFVALCIPVFSALPFKKKEREKMTTSHGIDCHFFGPGWQKSWHMC